MESIRQKLLGRRITAKPRIGKKKGATLVLDLYGWQNVSIAIEAKFLAAHGPARWGLNADKSKEQARDLN